jgi:DNA repair exonuclease SbcCD ATPase subunit
MYHSLMRMPSRLLPLLCLAALLSACAGLGTAGGRVSAETSPPPAPPPVLTRYLDTLARMAPGDPARQQAELAATLAAAQQTRSSGDTLRYALALGSAGHASSNPVEAKRLISELLASPNTLDPAEATFANAYLREFDARVALYAEVARQREESEQSLKLLDATADRRAEALATENKQLKRKLAEAERKLEAVAEMERSLLEQAGSQVEQPPR